MKKLAYQIPEVKIKALYMEQLMTGSITATGGFTDDIGYGGPADGEGDAKEDGFKSHSVWDD